MTTDNAQGAPASDDPADCPGPSCYCQRAGLPPATSRSLAPSSPGPGVGPRRTWRRRLVSGQALTAAEVADVFRVTRKTVDDWARGHRLPDTWEGDARRFPAGAMAEPAGDRNALLPDWLAPLTAGAQQEAPL